MVTLQPQTDVICLGVPEEIDPTTKAGMAAVMAGLRPLAQRSVWAQWSPGHGPVSIRFEKMDWLVTNQVADVQKFQPAHDCATCLAGNDQAEAFLREHPERWIAMGNLTYTEVWP